MKGLRRFMAISFAALLVCSTLANDYMIVCAEETTEEVAESVEEAQEEVQEETQVEVQLVIVDEASEDAAPEQEETEEQIQNGEEAETPEQEETETPVEAAEGYITYIFMNNDSEYDRQTVKDGEELFQPADPVSDAGDFIGWYKGDEKFTGFGVVTVADGVEDTVILTAVYSVSEFNGEITVTTIGETVTYDGEFHGATVIVEGLPEKGYIVETAESEAEALDVTVTPVKAECDKLVIKNEAGEDVTDTLHITYVSGEIVINPATLTIVFGNAEKEYDGTPLVPFVQEINGLVGGQTVDVIVKNSMLDVKRDADQNVLGVPIEYEIGWAESEENSSLSDVYGQYNATITSLAKKSNYSVSVVNGELKIMPAVLKVRTYDAVRIYNGKELTAGGEYSGLAKGEDIIFTTTGKQKEVGSSVNTYEIIWLGAMESNYTVEEKLGSLTVNPVPVTPDPDSDPSTPSGDQTPTSGDPAASTDDPGVLGARRGVEADAGSVLGASREEAVLGARRGADTGDENAVARYIMMMGLSVSLCGIYTIVRRKMRKEVR